MSACVAEATTTLVELVATSVIGQDDAARLITVHQVVDHQDVACLRYVPIVISLVIMSHI